MTTRTMPGFTAAASLYKTSGHYRTGNLAPYLREQQTGAMRLSAVDVPGEVIEIEDDASWSPPSWGGHSGPGTSGPPTEPGGGGGGGGAESSGGEPPSSTLDEHGCSKGLLGSKAAKPCTELRKLELKDPEKNPYPHYLEYTEEQIGKRVFHALKCCQQKGSAEPKFGRLN